MELTKFKVEIMLKNEMLGTVPKDRGIYKTFIESKKPPQIADVETETVPENLEERGWTGFHQDDKGFFIYDYMIKGFLKNAANVLKDQLKIKNLKSKITDFVFVTPRRIRVKEEVDGINERSLRVMTMQGPRTALVRSDFFSEGTKLCFTITMLKHKEISTETLKEIFSYGEFVGLGQNRNGGFGAFEITTFEEVG